MMAIATTTPIVVDKATSPAFKSASLAFTSLPYEVVVGLVCDTGRCTVLVFETASAVRGQVVRDARMSSKLADCAAGSVAATDSDVVLGGTLDVIGFDCDSFVVVVGRLS